MHKALADNTAIDLAPQWRHEFSETRTKENHPWLLLKNHAEKLNYRFDSVAEFFGREDSKHDGVGFCFEFPEPIQPGTCLDVAIPLPRCMRPYQAEVVSCTKIVSCGNGEHSYEVGIWLRIDSELDLISIKRSCDYLSLRY